MLLRSCDSSSGLSFASCKSYDVCQAGPLLGNGLELRKLAAFIGISHLSACASPLPRLVQSSWPQEHFLGAASPSFLSFNFVSIYARFLSLAWDQLQLFVRGSCIRQDFPAFQLTACLFDFLRFTFNPATELPECSSFSFFCSVPHQMSKAVYLSKVNPSPM